MLLSFVEHREVEMRAQGAAMQQSAVNPAQAVDHSAIREAIAASSAYTTNPSTSAWTLVGRSPQPPRHSDRSKGKEPMQAADSAKCARDGSEPEPVRKKASRGIRLAESSKLREVAPTTAERVSLRELQGEGSSRSPSYPWIQAGFKLPDSRRGLDSLALEVQRSSPRLTNLPQSNSRTRRLFGKAMLYKAMDSNISHNLQRVVMDVEDTVGYIGAHLS